MKKLFFFAAAAVAMLASCQKTEIDNSQPNKPIDDSKPVAMQFGVNAPSFEVTKTKAAVGEWKSTPIQVIGLINEGTATEPKYDFTKKVFDQEAIVLNSATQIDLFQKNKEGEAYAGEEVPYFYAEKKLYDFYAYHLGGAEAEKQVEATNTITRKVTITGSEDLMVAQPNKKEDIKADNSLDGVTTADVYSAWAARRNVQPTLVFEHALTRFNFIVRGMDEEAETVTITGISMTNLAKTGTLTVVGEKLGFVADAVVKGQDTLKLTTLDADGNDLPSFVEETVKDKTNDKPAGNGSCLMVQPDLENISVVIDMYHTYDGKNNEVKIDLDPYKFTVNASQVLKEGVAAGISTFAAGTAYNIYINVYGPQEIIIKAELTKWEEGGDYTYDPDQERPGGQTTSVTAERKVEGDVISYAITYTPDITAIEGAIAETKPADDSDAWETLIDTRATTGIQRKIEEGEDVEKLNLWVRYITESDTTDTWTTPAEPVAPAFTINKTYLVKDEVSYNELPKSYIDQYSYAQYQTDYSEWVAAGKPVDANIFCPLPWLVIEVTPGSKLEGGVTYENGDFKKVLYEDVTTKTGLIATSPVELGLEDVEKLTPGEWIITVNGIRTKLTVVE